MQERRGEKKGKERGRREDAGGRPSGALSPVHGEPETPDLRVVGIGASAGGLEAIGQLLRVLPADPGFALVFVQHLAPSHESMLPDLLAAGSAMKIVSASDGDHVEPNVAYVLPPNRVIELIDGRLRLLSRSTRRHFLPIDVLFESLAREHGEQAVGVLLSGMASDGVAGLREIKAAGGTSLVQSPPTARFRGMPEQAIAMGLADLVLSPERIGEEIVRLVGRSSSRARYVGGHELEVGPESLERIFELIREATGIDFSEYKTPTIRRRLQRRMTLHRIDDAARYVRFLEESPDEVLSLYRDVLIHVTSFFREPESFEALARIVFPRLTKRRSEPGPIRIWVPGCATGEEAYSIAIALLEYLASQPSTCQAQIFATDVSDLSIERARTGVYPTSIEKDLPRKLLGLYFTATEGGYRIAQHVRDLCVFAHQDITRDPPFSRLDLVVCRNLLIYLGPPLQKRLMGIFHYALKANGFLMLGHAETVGSHTNHFALEDKKNRIYTKRHGVESPQVAFSLSSPPRDPREALTGTKHFVPELGPRVDGLVLAHYGPPGVVMDADLTILQTRGDTSPYLRLEPGTPTLNLQRMLREDLAHGVRGLLQQARKAREPVRRNRVRLRSGNDDRQVDLQVLPVDDGDHPMWLLLFEERAPDEEEARAERKVDSETASTASDSRVVELQRELDSTRDHMQAMIQDLEAANEELQSANEEILSSNEELQSTNEELDTAREELQSTNEELQSTNEEINTINEELQARNDELVRLNSDLVNLLASVQIAIVIVGSDLRIRRFTPMAERVLNLIAGDVGRPIGHIKPNIDCEDLEEIIHQVVETVSPLERRVEDPSGSVYLLRIPPYKNVDNRIDGAVLSLYDVDDIGHSEGSLRHESSVRAALEAALDAQPGAVAVIGPDLDVVSANESFRRLVDFTRGGVEGRAADLGPVLLEEIRVVLGGKERASIEVDGVGSVRSRHLRAELRRFAPSRAQPHCLLWLEPEGDGD